MDDVNEEISSTAILVNMNSSWGPPEKWWLAGFTGCEMTSSACEHVMAIGNYLSVCVAALWRLSGWFLAVLQ